MSKQWLVIRRFRQLSEQSPRAHGPATAILVILAHGTRTGLSQVINTQV